MSNTGPTKCSVCGKAHWMRDPHIWEDEPRKLAIKKVLGVANGKVIVANNMANTPKVESKPVANIVDDMANKIKPDYRFADVEERFVKEELGRSSSTEEQRFCKPNVEGSIPSSGSTYKYRDAEKRRAYQREYMRKRRFNGSKNAIRADN